MLKKESNRGKAKKKQAICTLLQEHYLESLEFLKLWPNLTLEGKLFKQMLIKQ